MSGKLYEDVLCLQIMVLTERSEPHWTCTVPGKGYAEVIYTHTRNGIRITSKASSVRVQEAVKLLCLQHGVVFQFGKHMHSTLFFNEHIKFRSSATAHGALPAHWKQRHGGVFRRLYNIQGVAAHIHKRSHVPIWAHMTSLIPQHNVQVAAMVAVTSNAKALP